MESSLQSIIVEDVGEVKVRRRRGQKSTTLRLSKSGEIIISTNYSTPLYSLKHFVSSQKDWIDDIRQKSGLHETIEIFDGQIIAKGLKFGFFSNKKDDYLQEVSFAYRKGWDCIKIYTDDIDSIKLSRLKRVELEKLVAKALRERASQTLPTKLKYFAEVMKTSYSKVTIRNTSSRWGSCSSKNDINLSLWLMILPQDLIDYVLIHELAHTKFKHHGADFWDEVARFEPNYKILRKKLKKYSGQVWW